MSEALTRMRIKLADDGVAPKRREQLLFWATAFLNFVASDDLEQLQRADVECFLAHLMQQKSAGSPARDRALDAIELLFRHTDFGAPSWLKVMLEERRRTAMPNVLTRDEVRRVLLQLMGREWLAAALVYATGIRLIECLRLRVRDLDLGAGRLAVRDPADRILRSLTIPSELLPKIGDHIEELRRVHIAEVADGAGEASLPPSIAARQPPVGRSWAWQYLFPERHGSADRVNHHIDPRQLHQRFERAATEARVYRRVTGHVLRNSFALHMIQRGVPVRRVEQLLGTSNQTRAEGGDVVTDSGIAPMRMPRTEVDRSRSS